MKLLWNLCSSCLNCNYVFTTIDISYYNSFPQFPFNFMPHKFNNIRFRTKLSHSSYHINSSRMFIIIFNQFIYDLLEYFVTWDKCASTQFLLFYIFFLLCLKSRGNLPLRTEINIAYSMINVSDTNPANTTR